MALFSGHDLIAVTSLSESQIVAIASRLGIRKIGELMFLSKYPHDASIPGLTYDNSVGAYKLDDRKNADGSALSDNFSGWVYPNGARFVSKDFQQAANIYNKGDTSLTSFTVPDLTDKFFKGHGPAKNIVDPVTYQTYMPLDTVPHCNHVPKKHSHSINEKNKTVSTNMTIKNGFQFMAASNAGTTVKHKTLTTTNGKSYRIPYFHKGDNKTASMAMPLDIVMDMGTLTAFFSDADTDSVGDVNPDCYPRNQSLPVMIYIKNAVKEEQEVISEKYVVNFIDTVDGHIFHYAFVEKGHKVDYPNSALIPSHAHFTFNNEFDPPSISAITGNVNVRCIYDRAEYTVTIQMFRFKEEYTYGKLEITVSQPNGTTENYTLEISSGYDAVQEINVEYGARVQVLAKLSNPSKTRFKYFEKFTDSSPLHSDKYYSDLFILDNVSENTTIKATFGTELVPDSWRLVFSDYNLNEQEKRQRYYDKIAAYSFAANTLSNSFGPIGYVYEEVVNETLAATVQPKYREFVELYSILKDIDIPGQTTTKNYGIFLLCSQKNDKKENKLFANIEENAFCGFKIELTNGEYFITPVENFTIEDWQSVESDVDTDQIGINNTSGEVKFNYRFGPLLLPIPAVRRLNNSGQEMLLKVHGPNNQTESITLATSSEYEEFWGKAPDRS